MQYCLACAKEGDPAAVEAVVERLRPRLVKMAAYYGRRTGEDPDDLLQEAWFGLLEALRELDPRIGSPEQFLIKRARWRLLDMVKRARLRRCVPLDDALPLSETSEDHVITAACTAAFTARLAANQRAVLDCLLVGLTWREAGARLGCSSANIAYHVRQIRRQYEAWSGERQA